MSTYDRSKSGESYIGNVSERLAVALGVVNVVLLLLFF